jgi:hypothetical protein
VALARVVLCVAIFAVALVETFRLGVSALDRFRVRKPAVGLNLVPPLFEELEAIRSRARDSGAPRLAFLGDSISIGVLEGGLTVPGALDRDLGGAFEVHSLAALGLGPFDYYFLADRIAEARPDQVVIAFSLQSLGASFRSLAREDLSGWVAPARLPEVALAQTHWIGLHTDELLMNAAIVNVLGAELWRRLLVEQARVGVARKQLVHWLGEAVGRDGPRLFELAWGVNEAKRTRTGDPSRERYNAVAERSHYGPALDGLEEEHAVLQALAGTEDVLRRAGIRTLVYVNPVNVEHLDSLGLLADDGLSRSLAAIEAVVRSRGGDFLDLHALLPDAAFRDAAGHLGPPAAPDGPEKVAAAVAARLRGAQNWK